MSIPLHRVKDNGKVDLWDLGPARPEPPEAPMEVDVTLKGHEIAIAQNDYDDAMEIYKRKLREFSQHKRDYQHWHESNGGPVKIEFWGIDARDALDKAPHRFMLDLPRKMKPGEAQIRADEMAQAEGLELAALRERDPNFGKPQGIQP